MYTCAMSDLEDDISYKRNMTSLFEELLKPNKNHDIIRQLLQLTFSLRREIIDYDKSATSLIEHFIFFKTKKWVIIVIIKLKSSSLYCRFMKSFS